MPDGRLPEGLRAYLPAVGLLAIAAIYAVAARSYSHALAFAGLAALAAGVTLWRRRRGPHEPGPRSFVVDGAIVGFSRS